MGGGKEGCSGQHLGAKVLKAGAMPPSPPAFCIMEKGAAEPGGKPCFPQLSPWIRTCPLEEYHFEDPVGLSVSQAHGNDVKGTFGITLACNTTVVLQNIFRSQPRPGQDNFTAPCGSLAAVISSLFSILEALWRRSCLVLFVCSDPSIVGSWTMIGTLTCSMNTNVIN